MHRGLPSGYLTFIFALDEPVVTGSSPEQAHGQQVARHQVLLSGLHTEPAYVVAPTGRVGIQLAVSPIASRALFGVPARELAGALTSEGGHVVGREIEHVRERLAEMVLGGATWSAAFGVLDTDLRRRVERHRPAPVRPEIGAAWRWIARHEGTGSMSGLARHVALSPRQLSTVFERELWVSPKMLSRLLRFHRLIGAMSRTVAAVRAAGGAFRIGFMTTPTSSPTTPPAPMVWPALQARDCPALIDFLVDVVGFRRTAVYADGDQGAHAQLDWPEGAGIMLGSYKPGGEWSREPGTGGAYVVTDRVDEVYK